MRLFLAINLPVATRDAIAAAIAPMTKASTLKWSTAHRLHLTLKFLDEQPESAVRGIAEAMDAVAAKHFAFEARIGGAEADAHVATVGAFPNFRKPRVVWMGVHSDPRLELLHHDIEVACDALGFPIEGRPFRPHITLARVGEKLAAPAAKALERAAKKVEFDADVPVASVDLMKSVTGQKRHPERSEGATYERLHASPLKTR